MMRNNTNVTMTRLHAILAKDAEKDARQAMLLAGESQRLRALLTQQLPRIPRNMTVGILGGSISRGEGTGWYGGLVASYGNLLTQSPRIRVVNAAMHATGSALASFCVGELLPPEIDLDLVVL